MLLVISQRVAFASPDSNLFDFAKTLRDLLAQEGADRVHWQRLYLAHPSDKRCLKFTFTIDYFGAQADGRWWHDHRVPGGIAFTANSVGHMKWYADWYEQPRKNDWVLRQAMETIAGSANTSYGKATWLKSLPDSRQPVVARLANPFDDQHSLKPALRDKDWTRYGGFLHTDHSVRPEFFRESPAPDDIDDKSWLQDFTYLYDPTSPDHARFVAGEECPFSEAVADIGDPETYVEIETPRIQTDSSIDERPISLRSLFAKCEDWQLLPEEVKAMLL